jgi:hypothetical protein
VWNLMPSELWRRTIIAIDRHLHRLARQHGIPDVHITTVDSEGRTRSKRRSPVRAEFDKGLEFQRRAAAHFHVIFRLDGRDPDHPDARIAPPPELDAHDLKAAIDHAAATVAFTTQPHPSRPDGWRIAWGEQFLTKLITPDGNGPGEITMAQVAAYLAKYATKSTEVTGHTSARITADTIDLYADRHGSHTERLIDACWRFARARWTCPTCHQRSTRHPCPTCAARGRHPLDDIPEHSPYRRLQRWAHMLGFGGHCFTKSRRYSITFATLRDARIIFRRNENNGPEHATATTEPTTLVVNFLQFVGAGWRTPADAMLANTSAALAREHAETAKHYLTTSAA